MRPHYSSAAKALSLEELAQQCDIEAAERRFWSKVGKRGPDECWLWQGCWSPLGYGRFMLAGRSRVASRVAYLFAHGVVPAGLSVCHDCPGGRDNPRCVNPSHLFLSTQAENVADCIRKGRFRNGYTGRLAAPMPRYVPAPRPRRVTVRKRRPTLAERLEWGLDKSGDCWLWTRAVDRDGYGRISGRANGKRFSLRAHRLAYELAYGPVAPGFVVCHRCDTPGCCNPAHLFLGTPADNARDRDGKGHGVATLTAEQCQRIVNRYMASDINIVDLAKEFGTTYWAAWWALRKAGIASEAQRGRGTRRYPRRRGANHPQSKLSAAQRAALVDAYVRDGLSLSQVGAQFGISQTGVRNALRAAGVPTRTSGEGRWGQRV